MKEIIHVNICMNEQTYRQTDTKDKQTDRQLVSHQTENDVQYIEPDRTYIPTDRQTNTQTDRQTYRYTAHTCLARENDVQWHWQPSPLGPTEHITSVTSEKDLHV